ncbi:MAG: NUDIX protein [Anaerolineales bacterium]|nr:NUDIX protein [Anaerolineales bacterium]
MRDMPDKFCSRCGAQLTPKLAGGRERATCPACGYVAFGRFSMGVGALLVREGRVLLVQRGENPGKGRWTLPGGYVEEDETPDVAVVREVFEETGLRVRVTGLLAIRNTLRDDDQNAYYVFRAELDGPAGIVVDGTETVRADFFAPEEFDSLGDLAPLSRWVAEHHAGAGLTRAPGEGQLKPLVGNRWALFAIH